jgi:hypothetical protein
VLGGCPEPGDGLADGVDFGGGDYDVGHDPAGAGLPVAEQVGQLTGDLGCHDAEQVLATTLG